MAKPSGFSGGFGPGFGVGRYHYGLQQYIWDADGFWRLPSSVVGSVDLRPLPAQGTAGGAPQGFAFVASLQPVDVPIANALHFSDENATTGMRDAWEAELGYRPNGDKVADLLWDMLTFGSDPTGDAACKSLMPGANGFFELVIGGHSVVKRKSCAGAPEMQPVRELLRRDYRRLRLDALAGRSPRNHHRKVLGAWVRKYRMPYRWFQPADLPDESDLPPTTTLLDDFNRTDADALGSSSEGWSWSELAGDMDIVSNACSGSAAATAYSRADSDLSSDDHYAQVSIIQQGTSNGAADRIVGPLCRKDGTAAETFYYAGLNNVAGGVIVRLYKRVTTTPTQIGSDQTVAVSLPDTIRATANGSTIAAAWNGSTVESQTDTAITGNLRCGIFMRFSSAMPVVDDFEAADLAVATGNLWYYYQSQLAGAM